MHVEKRGGGGRSLSDGMIIRELSKNIASPLACVGNHGALTTEALAGVIWFPCREYQLSVW